MDDARAARDRLADLRAAWDRALPDRPDRLTTMTGRVFAEVAIPTATGKYYAVHPVQWAGDECEGCAPTSSVIGSAVEHVLCIGPHVPVVDDDLIAYLVGDRWVSGWGPATVTPAATLCVGVSGCTGPLANATVKFVHGSTTYGPGLTGTDGRYCFPGNVLLGAGTLTVQKGPRFADSVTSVTIAGGANSIGRTLSPDPGYVCCGCNDPIKKTLHFTDAGSVGAVTLNWVSGTSWAGPLCSSMGYTVADCCHCDIHGCPNKDGTLFYRVVFGCNPGSPGNFIVSIQFPTCGTSGGGLYGPADRVIAGIAGDCSPGDPATCGPPLHFPNLSGIAAAWPANTTNCTMPLALSATVTDNFVPGLYGSTLAHFNTSTFTVSE